VNAAGTEDLSYLWLESGLPPDQCDIEGQFGAEETGMDDE